MLSIITLPTATSVVSSVSSYSSELFDEFLPIGLAVAGILGGVLLARFIGKTALHAIERLTGRGRRAGGRRGFRRI